MKGIRKMFVGSNSWNTVNITIIQKKRQGR